MDQTTTEDPVQAPIQVWGLASFYMSVDGGSRASPLFVGPKSHTHLHANPAGYMGIGSSS
jgi:hypothetical protein